MDEIGTSTLDGSELSFWSGHRFLLLIGLAILATSILVLTSMYIYYDSGASQLDLSRPGYKTVRTQVVTGDNDFKNYSSTGSVDQNAISEFKTLYSKQAKKIEAVDAFGGDPLNPDALGLNIATIPSE